MQSLARRTHLRPYGTTLTMLRSNTTLRSGRRCSDLSPKITGGIKMGHMPAGLRVKGKAIVRSIDRISAFVLRYGLVLVVFWIGCLKFTAYESKGVFNHAELCHYDARSMAGRVWISRACRVSRPVPGQGCCVVGSGYLDPGRFSEIRR